MMYIIADSSTSYLSDKLVGANGISTIVLDTPTGEELVVQPNTAYSITVSNNALQLVGDQAALPLQVYSTDIHGNRGWQPTGLVLTSSTDIYPGYLSQKISGSSNGTGTILTNIIGNQLQISLGPNINSATLSGFTVVDFARVKYSNTFTQTNTFNGETDFLGPVFISNSSTNGTLAIQGTSQIGSTIVLLDNNNDTYILQSYNNNFNMLYNSANSSTPQNIFQLTSNGSITISGTLTLSQATNNNQAITLGQGNTLYGQLAQPNTWTQNNTFNANVNILGNLNVQGTMTTLNTTNTTISDNIITLNSGDTSAGVSQGTAGILIDRGTLPSVAVYWNETNKDWELTEDGTNFYHILTTNDEPNINAGYLGGQPPSYYASAASLQDFENYVSNTYLPLAGGTITGNLTVDQTLNTNLITINLPSENSQNFSLYRTNLPNGEAILNLQIGDTQDGLSYLSIGVVTANWIDLFKFYNNGNFWANGNISGSTINGSNLNISGTSSLNTVTANSITTSDLTATGNVTITGSINTTGTSSSSISVGHNVGTVNFVSNSDGSGGGYIEWVPQSGMPNQLNITGANANALSAFYVDATTTNLNGNLTANNATLTGLTVNGDATISGTLTVTSTINGNLNGNASTASALQNSITIDTSGDVTGSASFNGSANITIPLTLASSGVTAGIYGNSTNIPQITIDSKGRITSASNVAVSIPSGSINVTGTDITMSGTTGSDITNATLTNTGVTAGTYGSVTDIPQITVDTKGRITNIQSIPLPSPSTTVTSVSGNITITPSDIGKIFELQTVNTNTNYATITLPAVSNGFYVYLYLNASNAPNYYYAVSPPLGTNIYWNGTPNTSINLTNIQQNQGLYYIFCDGTNYFLTYQANYYTAPINNAAFTGTLKTSYNTLDDGHGNTNFYGNVTIRGGYLMLQQYTSISGTTSGTIYFSQYLQGEFGFKTFVAQFINYENNSTTAQTITYDTAFTNTPIITTNTTGLTITTTTTTLTINAPNNTTVYNGIVKVEGF